MSEQPHHVNQVLGRKPEAVWEKPSWATGTSLRSTGLGNLAKQDGGDLAMPITSLPHLSKEEQEGTGFETPGWVEGAKEKEAKAEEAEKAKGLGRFFKKKQPEEQAAEEQAKATKVFKVKKEEPVPEEEMSEADRRRAEADRRRAEAAERRRAEAHYHTNEKKYPPRNGWIVIFMEDMEAGNKKDDVRVGKFSLDFKGVSVQQAVEGDAFEALYQGTDVDPKTLTAYAEIPLVLTTQSKGHDSKKELVGVIFEGAEALDTMRNAGPECRFYIRQAHVFPVKVAKRR